MANSKVTNSIVETLNSLQKEYSQYNDFVNEWFNLFLQFYIGLVNFYYTQFLNYFNSFIQKQYFKILNTKQPNNKNKLNGAFVTFIDYLSDI